MDPFFRPADSKDASQSSSEALPAFTHAPPQYVERPNPSWEYGQPVSATEEGRKWLEGLEAGWLTLDASQTDSRTLYQVMKSAIVPRPIAFVSSTSGDGVDNLAPYSFFQMISHDPPTIMFSASIPADGRPVKDSAANIGATKEFVVNLISDPWIVNADAASVPAPVGVSEWGLTGLTKEPSTFVKPPRVKESAFSMECVLQQSVDVHSPTTGAHTARVVFGTVKCLHARKDVLNEKGHVDPTKMLPSARAGDISYARVADVYRMPVKRWEAEKDAIEKGGFA